ncbi:class I SAM-dependent methyltransferase [Bradyrhizobium sp. CB1650]|uniref:class I SAM-dependent methyltransferase n=1 Tax=Bradyrhizobium sp. CB1650 TaxID=3039153 RepID=UPI002434A25E|nr:class I SAM-dependent methyltransferase [Bradyrhizobium sp. CB1650]WGD55349.1 class I SAM-dependent methyltransferase [Bradyrhizobium sp. CB1650]
MKVATSTANRPIDDTQNCLVCGGAYKPSHLPGLFKCSSCGFISANLQIPEAELEALYGTDYFHGQEYLDYAAEAESLRVNFRRRISTLNQLRPNLIEAELFEIGCAYGYFLQEVAPSVRRAFGIDISADAVERAIKDQNVAAEHADYLSYDLGRKVDVITMWDTIEHLKRPDLFVEKAADDLKTGGLLAITTGDIGSYVARLRGKHWRMIHPPTHLHYFSVNTLSRLLKRHKLNVVYVAHPGNSRRLRSVLYFLLVLKGKQRRLYDALRGSPVFNLDLTVNLFDIMYVVARKP